MIALCLGFFEKKKNRAGLGVRSRVLRYLYLLETEKLIMERLKNRGELPRIKSAI